MFEVFIKFGGGDNEQYCRQPPGADWDAVALVLGSAHNVRLNFELMKLLQMFFYICNIN